MQVRRIVSVAVIALLVCSFQVVGAFGATPLLTFGATYSAPDGSQCTHRGVDIAAPSAQTFASPVAGTVTFAGKVPGPHGGSVRAVTISSAQGTVSMLPFDSLNISKGETVDEGEHVGVVSESGDPSSPSPHVHVSLRTGDLYIDPSVLFAVAAPSEPAGETSPETATAPDTAVTPAPTAAPAPVRVPAGAGETPVVQGAGLGAGVSLAPAAGAGDVATTMQNEGVRAATPISSAGAEVTGPVTGVSVSPAARRISGQPVAPDGEEAPHTSALSAALVRSSTAWAAELSSHTAPAVGVLGGIIAVAVYLLGRRSFERRITSDSPVSHRLGSMLQQLRAGDTLRGLTSCSGPLPSQSRGRLAQRR